MGAALLKDLPRAKDILSTLRRNLPSGNEAKPLSCKIRLLTDDRRTVDFVLGLVSAGANAITIHAREAGDDSTKPAKKNRLIEVVKILKSTAAMEGVPVIINGDLYSRNDIVNLRKKSGADGIMLARPALYNTSIFRKPGDLKQIQTVNDDDEKYRGEQEEETRYGYNSSLLLSKTKVVEDYLTHAKTYQTHHKNLKYVICEMMSNRRTPSTLAPYMTQIFPGGQTIDKVCKCRSLEDLCKLWDVSTSSVAMLFGGDGSSNSSRLSGNIPSSSSDQNKTDSTKVLMHKYDDRYFLDYENLRQENEQNQQQQQQQQQPVGVQRHTVHPADHKDSRYGIMIEEKKNSERSEIDKTITKRLKQEKEII